MKVWVDREGKAVEGKEFLRRWQQGIQQVSPLQQMQVAIWGYCIVFMGVIWGMVYAGILGHWWLMTILAGSFIVSGSQFTAVMQKFILLQQMQRRFEDEK